MNYYQTPKQYAQNESLSTPRAWNLIQAMYTTEEIIIYNKGARTSWTKGKFIFGFTKLPALFVFWPIKDSDVCLNARFFNGHYQHRER